ncbi:hypothetical protein E1281_01585 [Actinomadura sp. KC345]|uniref:hypothetical protein n=1 Tax=Actinomadura sp. KC345 TaxID=2530371 RepID=UPI0010471A5D|nr:hypothetical protein [Actinomadura sp. KC345]TDC58363.1 hypothetical protein E1281_01585 [Actinomadura sp. KC345]
MLDNVHVRAVLIAGGTLALAALGAWMDEGMGRDTLGMLLIVVAALLCGPGTFWAVGASPPGVAALFLGAAGGLLFGVGLSLEINTHFLRENGIDASCGNERRLAPPSENTERWRLACPGGRFAELNTRRLDRGPDGLVPLRYDPRGRTDAVEAETWADRSSNPWPRRMLVGGALLAVATPVTAAWAGASLGAPKR